MGDSISGDVFTLFIWYLFLFVLLHFLGVCTGAKEGVPWGVVRIGGLASEGVMVIWYFRLTVLPSVCTYYSSVWVHVQTLPLHPLLFSGMTGVLQLNLRAAASPEYLSPYGSPQGGPPWP